MPHLEISPYVRAQALALADVDIINSKIEEKTGLTRAGKKKNKFL